MSNTSEQLGLFPRIASPNQSTTGSQSAACRSGTFADNMRLPVHRWFRYSAGFSAQWAASVISDKLKSNREVVLDPFAGSGTTLIAADSVGVPSIGWEPHPFVFRIAQAKLAWDADSETVLKYGRRVLENAIRREDREVGENAPLLLKCYEEQTLASLQALRHSYLALDRDDSPEWRIVWLALTSILRECSGVGTAQWQYVLPNKKKSRVSEPFRAFEKRIELFASDMMIARTDHPKSMALIEQSDARAPVQSHTDSVDLVVTSPPYPNNYDYADATRLEMTFWREVSGWADLQPTVRQFLLRSCSQHSAAERLKLDDVLADPNLDPIRDEISEACRTLEQVRLTKGGKKTYHTMIAAYFSDLAKIWRSLRTSCRSNATICFVVGDSAPYGVHVPAEAWLAELAVAAGFSDPRFEKLRERNVKWKNRKHRVPLQEGRLWLRG